MESLKQIRTNLEFQTTSLKNAVEQIQFQKSKWNDAKRQLVAEYKKYKNISADDSIETRISSADELIKKFQEHVDGLTIRAKNAEQSIFNIASSQHDATNESSLQLLNNDTILQELSKIEEHLATFEQQCSAESKKNKDLEDLLRDIQENIEKEQQQKTCNMQETILKLEDKISNLQEKQRHVVQRHLDENNREWKLLLSQSESRAEQVLSDTKILLAKEISTREALEATIAEQMNQHENFKKLENEVASQAIQIQVLNAELDRYENTEFMKMGSTDTLDTPWNSKTENDDTSDQLRTAELQIDELKSQIQSLLSDDEAQRKELLNEKQRLECDLEVEKNKTVQTLDDIQLLEKNLFQALESIRGNQPPIYNQNFSCYDGVFMQYLDEIIEQNRLQKSALQNDVNESQSLLNLEKQTNLDLSQQLKDKIAHLNKVEMDYQESLAIKNSNDDAVTTVNESINGPSFSGQDVSLLAITQAQRDRFKTKMHELEQICDHLKSENETHHRNEAALKSENQALLKSLRSSESWNTTSTGQIHNRSFKRPYLAPNDSFSDLSDDDDHNNIRGIYSSSFKKWRPLKFLTIRNFRIYISRFIHILYKWKNLFDTSHNGIFSKNLFQNQSETRLPFASSTSDNIFEVSPSTSSNSPIVNNTHVFHFSLIGLVCYLCLIHLLLLYFFWKH